MFVSMLTFCWSGHLCFVVDVFEVVFIFWVYARGVVFVSPEKRQGLWKVSKVCVNCQMSPVKQCIVSCAAYGLMLHFGNYILCKGRVQKYPCINVYPPIEILVGVWVHVLSLVSVYYRIKFWLPTYMYDPSILNWWQWLYYCMGSRKAISV